MTHDSIVNAIIFYFLCGTLDVFITMSCILTNVCVEANPLWNWITPKETMLVVCVMANLGVCLLLLYLAPRIPPHMSIYKSIIKYGLVGEGLGRVVFGAIPGILLLLEAGMIR